MGQDLKDIVLPLLKKDEGLRLFPYDDATGKTVYAPSGNITIGYGINLSIGISKEEADWLLSYRENIAEKDAEIVIGRQTFYNMSVERQAVIVCMAYHLGRSGLREFQRMKAAIERQDYNEAATEMVDSTWGRKFKTRARKLALIMRTGIMENG